MKSYSKSMGLLSRVETCGLTVVLFSVVTLPRPVLVPLSGFIPTKRLKNDSVSSMCKNQVVELHQINNTIKGRKCVDVGLKT